MESRSPWIEVMQEHKGKLHITINSQWFASNYYEDGTIMTGVYDTQEAAAREYCLKKDLELLVGLKIAHQRRKEREAA